VAGRWLDRTLVPLCGPVAVLALAGMAWARPLPRGVARWTKGPLVAGLVLLALVMARPLYDGLLDESLTALACAGVGAGVLGRAGRLVRWGMLPAAGFAVLVLMAAVDIARHPDVMDSESLPDLAARMSAALVLAVVPIVVGLAVNAALISRRGWRRAGVGLLPVLVVALPLVPSVLAEERFSARPHYDSIFAATPEMEDRALDDTDLTFTVTTDRLPDPPAQPLGTTFDPEPPQETPAPLPDSEIPTDPWTGFASGILLIGLAALTRSLFPYRE
jgi:hypothetical protein